jgi:hypothetical protein
MMVVFVRFVQRCSIALHPGMRFKLFLLFADANAQARWNSLPPGQPPESQGFCQTGRMNQPVPVSGIDHVRDHGRIPARKGGVRFSICFRKESLQRRLRRSETASSQT